MSDLIRFDAATLGEKIAAQRVDLLPQAQAQDWQLPLPLLLPPLRW